MKGFDFNDFQSESEDIIDSTMCREKSPVSTTDISESDCLLSQSVPEYYAGRDVFLTGGTGFVGKVFIYKLLHSCPKVNRIYVLARPKRGKDIQSRLREIFDSKLFDKLRQEQPDFQQKVIAIAGDTMEPNLGMSEADIQTLTENVSVVVNSAATVRFDEPMKYAIRMNVTSVQKMLNLAKKMTKLDAFIHVSTAYANCDRESIDAKVYESPMCPKKLMHAAEWMEDEAMNALTPHLLGRRPNTYTYTKAAAENLIETEGKSLPIAIVRPSIIGASHQDPVPGWVDNFNGPTGLFVAIGKGVMRTMNANKNGVADVIPVDHCVNQIIVTGWYTGLVKPGLRVYHNTTGGINPLRWGTMGKEVINGCRRYPMNSVMREPHVHFTTNPIHIYLSRMFDHFLPAVLMDAYNNITRRKPLYTKIQTRLWGSIDILSYFTNHHWQFNPDTQLELLGRLSVSDKKIFSFDVNEINWVEYMSNYIYGAKVYAMKEAATSIPKARESLARLRRRDNVLRFLLYTVVFRLVTTRIHSVKRVWLRILAFTLSLIKNMSASILPSLTSTLKRISVV